MIIPVNFCIYTFACKKLIGVKIEPYRLVDEENRSLTTKIEFVLKCLAFDDPMQVTIPIICLARARND